MHPYLEYVNPHLGERLNQMSMDKVFVKGESCWLYDSEGNRYLDMIASYGALPFGFNPPDIWEAIHQVQKTMEPSFVQPSALEPAGILAKILSEVVPQGLKISTFTNSGAEAVEAAIKLCRAKTGRKGILSTHNSFHGKTIGALSATGRPYYQHIFATPIEGFDSIPYGDDEALAFKLDQYPEQYAAFIVEPIQGEGGIIVPPPGYLRKAQELCQRYGVLFVVDEIQTGLGRTGRLFACEEENITPDVMLLAKALGGGIMPIGACLCTENTYTEDFGFKHSSTFAANTLACRVGIAVLKKLLQEDGQLVHNTKQIGTYLKDGLLKLKQCYPHLIKEVRGKGLMLGVEFHMDRDTFPGSFLGIMAEQELLAPVISSHLLNVNKIRVAPTLNGSTVIRVEPPLIVNREHCDYALQGFESMLEKLSKNHTADFLSYLIGPIDKKTIHKPIKKAPIKAEPQPQDGRFAFLVHPVDIQNYVQFDESLVCFSEEKLQELTQRWNDMIEPFVVSQVRITAKNGKTIYGEFICVPRTAEELLNLPKEQIRSELINAMQLAIDRGAKIVGLGAYTSVVSQAGQLLLDMGPAITTGNSYTVVAAIDAVNKAAKNLHILPEKTTAAIVGASGSIGRALCILQSERISQLILIGSPKWPNQSRRRLLKVAGEILAYLSQQTKNKTVFRPGTLGDKMLKHPLFPGLEASLEEYIQFAEQVEGRNSFFVISSQLDSVLPLADIVICATSSPQTLLTPQNLKFGALVCDISRPGNVSTEVQSMRPDVLIIDGGIVEVPGRPDLGWNFGFDQGLAYSCMAETMILALDKRYEHTSIGSDLNLETISLLKDLAQTYGFNVAELRSFNKALSDEEWNKFIFSRKDPLKASQQA